MSIGSYNEEYASRHCKYTEKYNTTVDYINWKDSFLKKLHKNVGWFPLSFQKTLNGLELLSNISLWTNRVACSWYICQNHKLCIRSIFMISIQFKVVYFYREIADHDYNKIADILRKTMLKYLKEVIEPKYKEQ